MVQFHGLQPTVCALWQSRSLITHQVNVKASFGVEKRPPGHLLKKQNKHFDAVMLIFGESLIFMSSCVLFEEHFVQNTSIQFESRKHSKKNSDMFQPKPCFMFC